MVNIYSKISPSRNWHKAIVFGSICLTVAFNGLAQNKRDSLSDKSKRFGVTVQSFKNTSGQGYRNGTMVRPRNGQQSYWGVNQWNPTGYNHTFTYNAAGLVSEDVATYADGTNYEKTTYGYDANFNNQQIERIIYRWENNQWVVSNGDRDIPTYTNGRLTESIYQSYSTGSWENYYRSTYIYNTEGKLTEIRAYQREGGEWEIDSKSIIAYANGSALPTSITYQELAGNLWVDEEREVNLTWSNTSTNQTDFRNWRLLTSTEQEWSFEESKWENDNRTTTTLLENGGYVEVEESWENGAWVNDYRYTEAYDNKGNLLKEEEESWNGTVYELAYGYRNTYTYTGDNLTQVITQRVDSDNESPTYRTYVNSNRWVYSNFQTITSSKEALARNIEVYPNPVVGKFAIKTDQAAGASVKVMNLAGQTLLSENLNSVGQKFDVAHLPAGTYILQIQSKSGVRTQKVVKL
jgi:hypothetical protein